MNYTVRLVKDNSISALSVPEGTNLLDFMRANGLHMDSPCGGNGTCGKCRVKVSGMKDVPGENEKKLLGSELLDKGYRLACSCSIKSDIEVYVDKVDFDAVIMTDGRRRDITLDPIIKKKYLELEKPEVEDQVPDLQRIMSGAGVFGPFNDLTLLRELPGLLRTCDFKATILTCGNVLSAIEPGNTTGQNFGIAVDIGTTTIAAYLYDMNSGTRLDVHSVLNPQRKFGADVLSRIEYTMKSPDNLREMQAVIVDCINSIISYFIKENGIKAHDIYEAVFVGNTTMMHFLMGLDAANIAKAPFIAVTTAAHRFTAQELGIDMNDRAKAIIFPAVSGYIGADTVAAALSSGMYNKNEISLLIDIGTNGEVILGGSEWLYSCSTAAGPAFEGANIRNGVGGITGAIDKITLAPEFACSVIGEAKPVGICGSGIVDAIAQMLTASVIDETGRIADEDEQGNLPDGLRERLTTINGQRAFLLVKAEESGCGTDIAITQKDIRELQNAKAAIAAGIKTLVKRAGIRLEDIARVYLAGGFGNYIDVGSALTIGLLPGELSGKIESIGNAAGEGAVEGLLSGAMLKEAEDMSRRIQYVELSASADFVNEYVECMMF